MTSISLKITQSRTILRIPFSPFSSRPSPTPNRAMSSSTKPPPTLTTRHSTCLCKSIHIRVTGQDKNSVLCHCDNCRHASGSAFLHNHRFMKSEIEVLKGEEKLRVYEDRETRSGNVLRRHFCGECGSPLWLSNSAIKGFAAFQVGNLEGEKREPMMELFKEGKYSWVGEVTGKAKL